MFSIVCPVHNKEKELRDTLDSVFSQGFQEFQLILVENASTDHSLEVIQSYQDARIHLIQAGKIGPGAARNLGVRSAVYPWIAFLDADDVWEKDHLLNLKKAIDQNKEKFFFSTSWVLWTRSGIAPAVIQSKVSQDEKFIPIEEVLDLSLQNSPPFWTSAIVVSKVAFDQVEGFPEALPAHGEDVALWFKLLHLQNGIYFINKATAKYRLDATVMTSKSFLPGQIYQVSFPGFIFEVVQNIVAQTSDSTLCMLWKKVANKYQYSALSKSLISGTFEKKYLNYLFADTDMKVRFVRIVLGNPLIRSIFKSYLLKNGRFHG